ncbi:MAG: hypothetical protein ACI8P9_005769, partial [Parasphingorhabdus sp.]
KIAVARNRTIASRRGFPEIFVYVTILNGKSIVVCFLGLVRL